MRLSLFVFLSILTTQTCAQVSLFDHFYEQGDTVSINLDTEWKKLLRNRKAKSWQPVVVTLQSDTTTISLSGRIRTRGNIRLQVCDNPSLKIKLDKASLQAAGFNDLNDWKLVLQCNSLERGEAYLRREQLAYDLHAIFTPFTHRTLPLTIQQTGKKKTALKAFLIESEEQLADRLGGQIIEPKKLSSRSLHRPTYVNMCLFNYLILNTDWAVFNLHNIEFLTIDSSSSLRPIPYDFDYSGWVGTSYAQPQAQLDISSVDEPYWLGRKVTAAELVQAANHYLDRREAATELVRNYPGLSKWHRNRLLKRLETFFSLLEDESQLLKLLD